jgi:predicted nucleic acid-binding protein
VAQNVVVDSGPIVAWLNVRDTHHEWAKQEFERLKPPLLTCEAVLTEAAFLVQRSGGNPATVLALCVKGVLRVAISLQDEAAHLERLTRRYNSVPMSIADACLVRLSEIVDDVRVMTFDTDFRVYRRKRRQLIPSLAPASVDR